MDITISAFCITLLLFPFLIIAVLIKLDSPGSIFFRQERVGKGGKTYYIWKIRTMIENAVEHGLGLNVTEDDSRITRIGKFLRGWGLDELPQLINVFKGEMSIVGPRPTFRYQTELYDDFQRQRLLMKPGITGLAITEGRNSLPWEERIKLDVHYVWHWSLWFDIKIIFKTFYVVLVTRKGIYGPKGVNDDFRQKSLITQEQEQ